MQLRTIASGLTAAAALIAFSGVSPQMASAASHRVPIDNSGIDGEVLTGACAFPVEFKLVTSREYEVKTSTGTDGTVTSRVTGSLVVTATNLSNGKSMTLNVSGPSTAVVAADGSLTISAEGRTLFDFTEQPAGGAVTNGMFLTRGLVSVSGDATTGVVTSFSSKTAPTDVCSELS